MIDWKLESLENGKEISAIQFQTEKEEYLWRNSKLPYHFWIFWPNGKNPYTPKFFSSGMTLKRVRCSFVVLTYSLDKAPDHIIGLNMVLDAIFMGRQDSQKLQGLYGNWITQLYFKIDFAQLMNRIFTSKFEGCSWTRSCSVDF